MVAKRSAFLSVFVCDEHRLNNRGEKGDEWRLVVSRDDVNSKSCVYALMRGRGECDVYPVHSHNSLARLFPRDSIDVRRPSFLFEPSHTCRDCKPVYAEKRRFDMNFAINRFFINRRSLSYLLSYRGNDFSKEKENFVDRNREPDFILAQEESKINEAIGRATKDGGGGRNDGIDKSFLSTARIIDVPLIFIVSRAAAGGNGYKDFSSDKKTGPSGMESVSVSLVIARKKEREREK